MRRLHDSKAIRKKTDTPRFIIATLSNYLWSLDKGARMLERLTPTASHAMQNTPSASSVIWWKVQKSRPLAGHTGLYSIRVTWKEQTTAVLQMNTVNKLPKCEQAFTPGIKSGRTGTLSTVRAALHYPPLPQNRVLNRKFLGTSKIRERLWAHLARLSPSKWIGTHWSSDPLCLWRQLLHST